MFQQFIMFSLVAFAVPWAAGLYVLALCRFKPAVLLTLIVLLVQQIVAHGLIQFGYSEYVRGTEFQLLIQLLGYHVVGFCLLDRRFSRL